MFRDERGTGDGVLRIPEAEDAPERCSFLETGPVRCRDEATALVEHRYGRGWYCDDHAARVREKWRPEPDAVPSLVVLQRQSSLPVRRPIGTINR